MDADAVPHLLEAMSAAGQHNLDAFVVSIGNARATLPAGRHKARPDLDLAVQRAEAGEWRAAWGSCHQAMCGLTYAYPPDISTCPTMPDDGAPLSSVCGSCGHVLPMPGRFCPACGASLS